MNKRLVVAAVVLLIGGAVTRQLRAPDNATPRVVLVVAHEGYQHKEYDDTKAVLEGAGIEVVTTSDGSGMATADDGSTTGVDVLLSAVDPRYYAGIFFIGGPGSLIHLDNPTSYQLAQQAKQTGRVFGAICASPRILARGGVLQGRRATGWNGDGRLEAIFSNHDVTYVPQQVVVDGRIITADGPMSARAFGQAIVDVLQK